MAGRFKRFWLIALIALSVVLLPVVVAFLCAPYILSCVPLPELRLDLTDKIPKTGFPLVTNATVAVKFKVVRSTWHELSIRGEGLLLDWPVAVRTDVRFSPFAGRAAGRASLKFCETPWRIDTTFAGSLADGWSADVTLPRTPFDLDDPLVGSVVRRMPMPSVTNLVCAGSFQLEAHAATTNGLPLPTWSVRAKVSDLTASLAVNGKSFSVNGLHLRGGVDGLGPHVDIQPVVPRIRSAEVAGFELSNVFASVRAEEKSLLVSEAGAETCGGMVRLYSLRLNRENFNAGFTLFVDGIDTGRVLDRVSGFRGSATGRLHGKMTLRVRELSRVTLSDSFLYSVPGETGTLHLEDATPVVDNLAACGVSEAECANVSAALANLEYSALNINLRREGENAHALTLKLDGTASKGGVTVPVNLSVTFHGALEQLINTGLRAARNN